MKLKFFWILLLSGIASAGQAADAAKGKAISGACATCHGVYGLSNSEQFPNLAGQKEAYLVKVLQAYQTGQRLDVTMQAQAGPLSVQDIEDLAAYYAGNSILPRYSGSDKTLTIPFIEVLSEFYQAELGQTSDTTFILNAVSKLK